MATVLLGLESTVLQSTVGNIYSFFLDVPPWTTSKFTHAFWRKLVAQVLVNS